MFGSRSNSKDEKPAAEGGFLALRVPTDRLADARDGLSRWGDATARDGGDGLIEVDLEAVFLRHLRAEADRRNVVWSNVEGADEALFSAAGRVGLRFDFPWTRPR